MYYLILLSFIGLVSSQCPTNIEPCVCIPDGPDLANATLDCSAVINDQQLSTIPGLKTPLVFAVIEIKNNADLTKLPPNAFGQAVAYEYVITDNPNLATVEAGFMNDAADPILINFSRNKIAQFPFADLKNLNRIEYIILQHNQLSDIPAGAFEGFGLTTLTDILLNDNAISTIGPRAFAGEKNVINAIVLSKNKLSELTSSSLCLDSQPSFLVLDNNQITTVAPDAFTCNSNYAKKTQFAKKTYLANNQLKSIEETSFEDYLTKLRQQPDSRVIVGGNPLVCDCSMQWLARRKDEFSTIMDGATCTAPPPTAPGNSVFVLSESYFQNLGCDPAVIQA